VQSPEQVKIPAYSKDIYSRDALLNSDEVFQNLRNMGDVVYLPKQKLYAIPRYDGVKSALQANTVLLSGKGIASNKLSNGIGEHTVLMSDGDTHKNRKSVLMKPLMKGKVLALQQNIASTADSLVASLVKRESFDVVSEFAAHLPLTIVADMVGLSEEGQKNMLKWASASFNSLGPANIRLYKAMPSMVFGLKKYADNLSEDEVKSGGWASRVFDAVNRNEISIDEGRGMILDYVAPSLDTTILAASRMFWELAKQPALFTAIKSEPALIPGVVNEAVRISSPIRGFTRYVSQESDVNGSIIPKDVRALILYARANMDERHYPNPDTFDIHRNPRDHVGWGHGMHFCAGSHLARLELEELLKALCTHSDGLQARNPTYICNNILQGFESIVGALSQ